MLIRSLIAAIAGLTMISLGAPALAHEATPAATPAAQPDLTAYVWEMTEIQTGPNSSAKPDDPTNYTVMFLPEGGVAIGADCNRAVGTYTTSGGDIDITVGATTMALCPPESLSGNFLTDLDQASSFVFADNGDLVLNLPMDGGFIRLRPSMAAVVWELTQFEAGNGSIFLPVDSSRYTIELMPDGMLAIGSDCNRGRGSLTRTDAEIDIEVLALTRAMCEPGSFSADFLTYLNQATGITFANGQMQLSLPNGAGVLTFMPEELTPVAPPR